ncbi:MAG: PCRF domain-containing protein, partial [Patescibacteria group bacterium]
MNLEEFKKNHRTSYLAETYERLLAEEKDLKAMETGDPSFRGLVAEDLKNIEIQKEALEKQMREIAEEVKVADEIPTELILEVRAGAGGDEAALFAEELAMMYKKYAENRGWKFKTLEESRSASGGYKEASFEISGKDVFAKLQYETGVHRIQRVP